MTTTPQLPEVLTDEGKLLLLVIEAVSKGYLADQEEYRPIIKFYKDQIYKAQLKERERIIDQVIEIIQTASRKEYFGVQEAAINLQRVINNMRPLTQKEEG